MSLKDKNIIVGMTGGIACYKVPYLVRALDQAGAMVQVIMTGAATEFITPLTMETVSKNPVAINMFPSGQYVATRHIELAGWADLFVIAPATANFIGKASGGISDDLLTTIICATSKPILMVPAMNPGMWKNPVTQKNMASLKELGFMTIGPEEGEMAEPGHAGLGRMSEPDQIFEVVNDFFSKKKVLSGKHILITAGPTREEIDPVRYLTNHSSGRMGYAIATVASEMGASVTLISGPVELDPPENVQLVNIITTLELHEAVRSHFAKADCLIMAAAPADFTPTHPSDSKIKRASGSLSLELTATADILKDVAQKKKSGQIIVGFALETDDGEKNARKKLKEKNLDMIVLNSPGEKTGFGVDTNQVTIIAAGRDPDVRPLASKIAVSRYLLEKCAELM